MSKNSDFYKDRILEVKTLSTMKKYFLHDVMESSTNFANQTLGKTIKMINRSGITRKQLEALYNDVKPIMYGSSKKQSIKKVKAESIQNVFPFGEDVFMKENNAINDFNAKISSIPFKKVAEVIEMNVTQMKIKDIMMLERHSKKTIMSKLKALKSKYGSFKVVFVVEAECRHGKKDKATLNSFTAGSSHADDDTNAIRVTFFSPNPRLPAPSVPCRRMPTFNSVNPTI